MTPQNGNPFDLLEAFVSTHEEEGKPITVGELATQLGENPADVAEGLQSLKSYELVQHPDGEGYVPTITARELLELDIDTDTFLILDFHEE